MLNAYKKVLQKSLFTKIDWLSIKSNWFLYQDFDRKFVIFLNQRRNK